MQTPSPVIPNTLPPHSIEAELWALGSALIRDAAVDELLTLTRAEVFYVVPHQHIWRAIADLRGKEQAINFGTVALRLDEGSAAVSRAMLETAASKGVRSE